MTAVASYGGTGFGGLSALSRLLVGARVIHERHRTRLGRYLEGRTAFFYNFWGIATLGLGAGMDVVMSGLWLPRAGAVVAGVAAYLYFFDPRTADDWWELRRKSMPQHLTPDLGDMAVPAKSRAEQRAEKMRRERLLEQLRVAHDMQDLAERRKLTFQQAKTHHFNQHDLTMRVQAYWLFIGTLIWAFGDIPVELLKCGRVPC